MGYRGGLLATMMAVLAACGGDVRGIAPPEQSWPPPPPPMPAAVVDRPEPRHVRIEPPAAIASDPEAQRFFALRRLVEDGLVAADDADQRRAANLGALLPYSAPPPAAGLARPAPLQDIADRLIHLSEGEGMPAVAAIGERDFLLDGLLPKAPKTRAGPAVIAPAALRLGRERVETLARLRLVDHDEFNREAASIERNQQILAAAPPPPPPPPPKKPVRKKPTAPPVKPGDVPGGAQPLSGSGPVGVHLLSMASDSLTDKAVDALKKEFPELAALAFKAVKTTIPELGTTYRLLAGPMSAAEAEQMCKALRAKGQSCAVSGY
ncbi:SPOR domain-containing protein [Magnetospirillum sp. SS-4]|uniref:SPOR domain-containing protein n=1 Tax=Magnetospirillum sp. SS-4 TaxID=2681465 RepID=UPI00137D24CC|nr:SPOR domain-containing protein [Magnetospirillum sp. SS-4]CAA7627352.1 conserved exported hypothetical protein [Magnetospirillum sp. SS-4]